MFFKRKNSDAKTPASEAGLSNSLVLKALSSVMVPGLDRDIVNLGFIKGLSIKGGDVQLTVELNAQAQPSKAQLEAACRSQISAIKGVTSLEVIMKSHSHPVSPQKQPGRIALPNIRNVIAVASGKGGVGKSTVTINLAVALSKMGARVGLLDADIYGPSLPLMMGINERPPMDGERVVPLEKAGIKLMSMGFLVPEDQAIVWRGPMVHGALTQFMSQVEWGDLDYLLIDMPPGTGDAQLTISQTAPLSGAIIVTTPQDVSLLDARRGMTMFQNVKIPILGVIENMAGFVCGHCGESTPIFSSGGGDRIARETGVPLLGSVPLDPRVTKGGDSGLPTVAGFPDSEVAKIFSRIAGDVASQLSVQHLTPNGNFKPMALEWQE